MPQLRIPTSAATGLYGKQGLSTCHCLHTHKYKVVSLPHQECEEHEGSHEQLKNLREILNGCL
ncbi:BnaCnng39510D [Brassica napus]|uniref:Uncharacterized protein n=2 Tax=Brassica TaxID=3705 RepID=A0A3P6CIT1_BRAOL|nr:unnamed protein product [Brassica napus]CDY62189.1 BnaCnng39510D [Brassica napus]VDD14400.1 unnamed protein product [Brassica oleracea]